MQKRLSPHRKRAPLLPLVLPFLLPFVPAPLEAQGYGQTVAIGQGEIFVGEPLNERRPGIVYVYRKSDGEWREAAQLTAPDGYDNDHFGRAIVPAGPTLLVGATSVDEGRGAVYVFQKNASGNWEPAGKVQPEDLSPNEYFGREAGSDGKVALFAAWAKDEARGAVYALSPDASGGWTVAKLAAEEGEPGDWFGTGLAVRGDLAVIGALSHAKQTGAAYIFRRDATGAWRQETRLAPEDLEENARFGEAVAIVDGLVLIAAPGFARNTGVVYTFERDEETGEWEEGSRLLPFDQSRFARFGTTLAVDGRDVWVGAPGADRFEGRMYRFERDEAGNWTGAAKVGTEGLETGDGFGSLAALADGLSAVAIAGDDYGLATVAILERSTDGWREAARVWSEPDGLDPIAGGEVECSDGSAALFDCRNVNLLSFVPISALGGTRGAEANDIWGWTDPETGREYALVGVSDRTTFVDVTDPLQPTVVGWLLKTEGSRGSSWRDIKVYKDHAYIVSDNAGSHGMQVFDLTRLRSARDLPVTFTENAHYDRIHSAHNIVLDTESGFAYSVGSNGGGETCGGGLHMIDIREPTRPTFAGCFADPATGRQKTGYTHDAQCLIYHGPDEEHRGKEICFGSNETALSISDVTDKQNPIALAVATYPNVGYAHQGWLTEDQRYFYMDDEGDEFNNKFPGTRTLVWNVEDLDDPVLVKEYYGTTFTSDHNLYVKGNYAYQSNYVSGLRILDISDPEAPREVGFFDTVPWSEEPSFDGSWSNYPFFESGTIVVTSQREGLFMVKKAEPELVP
ncbi:MAG: choice-of-anchor B family protein [Gemmatimonadota bacterium]